MRFVPVDVYLAEHVELHVVFLHKLLYVCLSSRLLTPELVAGKSENAETLGLCILFVKFNKLRVVLVGLSSLGCNINNECHMTFVFIERNFVSIDVNGREVIDGGRVLPTVVGGRHGLAG